ncbi:MAG: ATP-binding protein [Tissierellia bacterium]|nr:ATP-binding protein [Tissierellia bacterium]MDD4781434.1 ATP-binding protein [Tissierellia bacterium]
MLDKRLVIITGHYGSGKTEFAINYAIKIKENFENVSLADLDIVNPYFRSREKKSLLESKGIHVIESSIHSTTIELPALSSGIMGIIQNQNMHSILDVGGDPVGAKVLSRFSDLIKENEYDLFYVINGNRPETRKKEDVINYLKAIENSSSLRATGLINNTHLLKSTTIVDVEYGHELAKKVSWELDIPIRYEVAMESITDKISNKEIEDKFFPINLYMREEWMS